jgi:hypothetical protein
VRITLVARGRPLPKDQAFHVRGRPQAAGRLGAQAGDGNAAVEGGLGCVCPWVGGGEPACV